jgi:hypothetical protein
MQENVALPAVLNLPDSRLTRELREAHRSNNDDDLIRQVIGKVADAPRDPPPLLRQPARRERDKPSRSP